MKTGLPCTLLALLASMAFAQSSAPTAATTSVKDNKDLLGQWEGYVMAGGGSNAGQRRTNITLIITPDKITCKDAGNTGEGTYRISNGGGSMRNIDAIGTAGFYKDHLYEGIIAVEGNTLKWCAGDPGRGRPIDFRTVTSKGHFLMVLTRKQ
jgi:uncharacterized protein (TIGR03067 family)